MESDWITSRFCKVLWFFHCIRYNWRFHDTYLIFFVKRNYFLVLSKSLSSYLYGLETFLQSIWRKMVKLNFVEEKTKSTNYRFRACSHHTLEWYYYYCHYSISRNPYGIVIVLFQLYKSRLKIFYGALHIKPKPNATWTL